MINGQEFIAWIGKGQNSRGTFPINLSELNDDIEEFEEREGILIAKVVLKEVIWDAWYHACFEPKHIGEIDGNDHPQFLKLVDEIWNRLR